MGWEYGWLSPWMRRRVGGHDGRRDGNRNQEEAAFGQYRHNAYSADSQSNREQTRINAAIPNSKGGADDDGCSNHHTARDFAVSSHDQRKYRCGQRA